MTVDEFIEAKVLPQFRDVVQAIRALMREEAPNAKEYVTYGIPAWRGKKMLAVVSPTKKDITFAFSRGAECEDRYGLLTGVGHVSKNVKLKSVETMPMEALRYYISEALRLDES